MYYITQYAGIKSERFYIRETLSAKVSPIISRAEVMQIFMFRLRLPMIVQRMLLWRTM